MLRRARQSLRRRSLWSPYISLALVGLMWVVPFLHFRHERPLPSFDAEWWSVLLGVLALILLTTRGFWRQPEIPRIAQMPAALIIIILVQLRLNKIAYIDQGLLYILYLLFAAMLMVLGAALRDKFGIRKLASTLALFLLFGAELSALVGVIQHFGWHSILDPVITPKIPAGVYGNLAQSNHFASYITLGLISLGLLFHQRTVKATYAAALTIPLLFVLTLSGSRSTWIYLLMTTALAWWGTRRDVAIRPLLRFCLLLVVGFGLMHVIVQLPFMAGADISVDTMQRLLGDQTRTSNRVRLYLWHEAWLMFAQSPWLGVGFGQFAWHHLQLLPVLRPSDITGHHNNAHNLIFQIGAEAGIAGLLALFASLGVWLHALRRAPVSPAQWWGYAVLAVLGVHSLLEYPLWYSYFAAVAAILLGALDETRYRVDLVDQRSLRYFGQISVAVILLWGMHSLMQLDRSIEQLRKTVGVGSESADVDTASRLTRDRLLVVHASLLSPYAEVLISLLTDVNGDRLVQKIALNTNAMRFLPLAPVVYRQAFLLAQNGQLEQAKQVMEQAIWSYPGDVTAREQLRNLAEKDPARFSDLLKFAAEKEQERARAVRK